MNHRHYYAAHSYMGLNYTYDSPCWMVYAFNSAGERDKWLKDNCYDGRQYVAEAVSAAEAVKIAPDLRNNDPSKAYRVIHQ